MKGKEKFFQSFLIAVSFYVQTGNLKTSVM